MHGHVDLIDERRAAARGDRARHHELFSAAHRNGVTYAGYAFDCRCFSSALTAARRRARAGRPLRPERSCSTTTTSTSALALDCEIVFLEGPAMALYRHHGRQMTTYELTMGQIQTARSTSR